MKSQEELTALGHMCTSSIEVVKRTGIELVSISYGSAAFKMPLKGNENHVNMMYAGSLFVLAELPGGAIFLSAFDTSKFYPVVGEVKIRYLKPAKTDITVEVSVTEDELARMQNELDATGKCKFVLKQELKDTSGQVVAETIGTYMGLSF